MFDKLSTKVRPLFRMRAERLDERPASTTTTASRFAPRSPAAAPAERFGPACGAYDGCVALDPGDGQSAVEWANVSSVAVNVIGMNLRSDIITR
jgi:hypothetical protein